MQFRKTSSSCGYCWFHPFSRFMPQSTLILHQLKEMKYRLTVCRTVMISIFENSHTPLTVQDINRLLKRSGIKVNKTTIYRELDLLKSLGFVKEVEFGDGRKRFENATASHHHHFVCQNC